MTVNEAHLIYFSPTHTSKQVAEAIVHGTGIKNIFPINVTQQIADEIVIPTSSLAIIVCLCMEDMSLLWQWNVYSISVEWILLPFW